MAGEEMKDGPQKETDITLNVLLNRLNIELRNRFTRLNRLHEQFGFLLDTESLYDSNEDT